MTISSSNSHMRRLELSLNRTIEVIESHLLILKNHKINIEKYGEAKDWDRLFKENVKASQTVKLLKADLQEINNLSLQCSPENSHQLNEKISAIRSSLITSVDHFVNNHASVNDPFVSFDGYDNELPTEESSSKDNELSANLQIHADIDAKKCSFMSWNNLKRELFDLSSMTNSIASLVHGQGEQINRIDNNIDHSHVQIVKGTRELKKAAALKAALIPMTGAIIGGVVGGPIGLMAGFKLAGVAAASVGGIVGYAGGKIIQKTKFPYQEFEMITLDDDTDENDKKVKKDS